MMDSNNNNTAKKSMNMNGLNGEMRIQRRQNEKSKPKSKSRALILIGVIVSGTLVYYHCAYREASIVSLISDVLIVLLCSLAILGLLFRQLTIQVPVDPLEWQISQDTANSIVAWLANTIGAAESVFRVAATGHDKRLFFKVVICLYILSALGRLVSGVTVAYAGLCLFCLYMLAETSQSVSQFLRGRNGNTDTLEQDMT